MLLYDDGVETKHNSRKSAHVSPNSFYEFRLDKKSRSVSQKSHVTYKS